MSDIYSAAREYGRALFLLTEELGTTERVREEAKAIVDLFLANPEYERMLDTPALSPDERIALIDGALADFDESLLNLVKILIERRMAYAVVRTLRVFEEEYMESRGIIRAEVISAIPLSEVQSARICEKLGKITGKQVVIDNKVDPSLLGGINLRYMGIQRDGSIKTRLDDFASSLKSAVI
jgi:ATP synthase F1 delta subunit